MSVPNIDEHKGFYCLQKQFFATVSLKTIDWKDVLLKCCSNNGESFQLSLLGQTILHPCNKLQPVRLNYQTSFLKLLISQIESENAAVASEIFETYCCLINFKQENEAYIHFFADDPAHPLVTVSESVSVISNGTTGLSTWPSARALAEFASKNLSLFSGKKVLELGCGTGLLGLSIIKIAVPSAFFFTDCHPDVLRLAVKNIALNFREEAKTEVPDTENIVFKTSLSKTEVLVLNLPWEDVSRDIVDKLLPDIVIAADVVYDKSIIDALVAALKLFCSVGHSVDILVACAERNEDTLNCFVDTIVRGEGQVQELRAPPTDTFFYTCDVPLRIFKIEF